MTESSSENSPYTHTIVGLCVCVEITMPPPPSLFSRTRSGLVLCGVVAKEGVNSRAERGPLRWRKKPSVIATRGVREAGFKVVNGHCKFAYIALHWSFECNHFF